MLKRVALAAGAIVLVACGDDPLERVRVCGDLAAPAELVAVRVTALGADLAELAAGVAELAPVALVDDGADDGGGDGADVRQLPIVVALPPVGGARYVRAQGLGPGEVEVVRADVRVSGLGAGDDIVIDLGRDCLGRLCALGQTCVAGACTVTPAAGDVAGCRTPEANP
ncbi:MAG: hypothetical protein IT385_05425 [Deltaproteobacteria bacterium]|nr:hypothetical protein [Deltaproteobacteria bacterium]